MNHNEKIDALTAAGFVHEPKDNSYRSPEFGVFERVGSRWTWLYNGQRRSLAALMGEAIDDLLRRISRIKPKVKKGAHCEKQKTDGAQ